MPESVTLGEVWSRRGFLDAPNWIWDVVREALDVSAADEPEYGEVPGNKTQLTQAFKRWASGGAYLKGKPSLWGLGIPRWQVRPTLDDILIELRTRRLVGLRSAKGRWCWPHYPFAFGVYWALVYHTPNAYLEFPDLVWDQLMAVVGRVYEGRDLGTDGLRQVRLALYERTLGIEHDRQQRLPHYVQNVDHRPELRPEEQRYRALEFPKLVAALKTKILHSLDR